MSETLTLHLYGPFRATLGATALTGLSRRAQALLAYLACQPAMRAERALLADLLWADRASDQARASLRQELSVLRKHLPNDLLNADRQMVWLNTAQVTVATGPEQFLHVAGGILDRDGIDVDTGFGKQGRKLAEFAGGILQKKGYFGAYHRKSSWRWKGF